MNATTNPAPKQRKPRAKPARFIRILAQPGPDTDGWAAISITVAKQTDTYLLRSIPTDFGNGALAFEVEKLDADLAMVEQYHVLLNGEEKTCDCKGHLRHGHCKHREGIETLIQKGKLPAYRSAGQLAANDADAHRDHENAIALTFTAKPKHCPEPEPAA